MCVWTLGWGIASATILTGAWLHYWTGSGTADSKSKREDRDAAAVALKIIDEDIRRDRERQATRWQILWEKEVVSDLSSTKEAGNVKVEVEKLFHRAP